VPVPFGQTRKQDPRTPSHCISASCVLVGSLEQMGGVEPADPGVAHRRVTATLHLLGGLARRPIFWIAVGARSAFDNPSVGWEGIEPSSRRIKSPLQSQRLLPTQFVPPAGVEPTSLGFQPRAQTAAEWDVHRVRAHCSTRGAFLRVPAWAPFVITLQLSEIAGVRFLGAPRAWSGSQTSRAHPSRTDDLKSRSSIRRIASCSRFGQTGPKRRKEEGPPGVLPWRPVQHMTLDVRRVGVLQGTGYR
jgi:hypothetical protein